MLSSQYENLLFKSCQTNFKSFQNVPLSNAVFLIDFLLSTRVLSSENNQRNGSGLYKYFIVVRET